MAAATDPTGTLAAGRGLLTPEDYEALLKRIEDDPARWLPAHERAPNAAGTLGASG